MFRLFVERKPGFENEAKRIFLEIRDLGITSVEKVRFLNRYDVENVDESKKVESAVKIFSEPQSDFCYFDKIDIEKNEKVILWEYLPGQYDQRADSAVQCLSILCGGGENGGVSTGKTTAGGVDGGEEKEIRVRSAKMVILSGNVSDDEIKKIENYLINPVDSRLADEKMPRTLEMATGEIQNIPIVNGFIGFDDERLEKYRDEMGLAMDVADIKFLQDYFKSENRDPTETEIRVLDTYWSDHCRHTTFLTELKNIEIEDSPFKPLFEKSLENYKNIRAELYSGNDKPICLMDMAVIGMKYLKKHGSLEDLEVSEENNACSVYIDVHYTQDENGKECDKKERYLLMFKNETHNHPTEIEPFGGAATCIGGAIRDPLSGRSWVYQSMRVTGAADPTVPLVATLKGKLPQAKICREAAQGFSSYGNQIGLTTGQVTEIYHPGFLAKRMELGAVIAAAPENTVVRERPSAGDVIILLGGGTGRDGIGGATGSSKVHTKKSVSTAAAEVQKGNAVEERKIQRLFRNKDVSLMIKRCNDFGAGGVSVAIGELAHGLEIDLDKVPKKYAGLNGTELAISESQERMAVVVKKADEKRFIEEAKKENLIAVKVALVTDTNRLVMKWWGETIVDIKREFLDAAGAHHEADAVISAPCAVDASPLMRPLESVEKVLDGADEADDGEVLKKAWLSNLSDLAVCSQRGLQERFDGSIGASTVIFPFGGKYQGTPEAAMCAKIPVLSPLETSTVSLMSFGYDPRISEWSPYHGAQISVISSLAKIACLGGRATMARLSFQEFFGRAVDKKTWGYPLVALLGSIDAQLAMKTASIGGKDSMSGTFENINVPHTLVSFAVTHDEAENITSGAFKKAGHDIYLVRNPFKADGTPDFDVFTKNSEAIYAANKAGKIAAMYPVGAGGIAEAVSKMAFGNKIGCEIENLGRDLFLPMYGSIVIEVREKDLGESQVSGFRFQASGGSGASEIDSYGDKSPRYDRAEQGSGWQFVEGTVKKIGETVDSGQLTVISGQCESYASKGENQVSGFRLQASGGSGASKGESSHGGGCTSGSEASEIDCHEAKASRNDDFGSYHLSLSLDELEKTWEGRLEKVYASLSDKCESYASEIDCHEAKASRNDVAEQEGGCTSGSGAREIDSYGDKSPRYDRAEKTCNDGRTHLKLNTQHSTLNTQHSTLNSNHYAIPKVLLPVFPGTNCEYDMMRAFNLAGARTKIVVIANKTRDMLEESLAVFAKELRDTQILALSGGFSAGDEPDGSAKFIANCLRDSRIADEIMNLLKKRDGLVLGICNGFQALVKTGLAVYGEFVDMTQDMPTLTFNNISRHVSRIVRTRLVSDKSPWANDASVLSGKLHLVPISHGEGRFVVGEEEAKRLFENGQVFTQYVDVDGKPTMNEPDNPNGSFYAIEGITSPDGRILGKMGHSERTIGTGKNGESADLMKNIVGCDENETTTENIFRAGVRYFEG